jgi:uncharacterized sulfatase
VVTLPQLMRRQGYTTARVSKIFHGGKDDPASWDLGGEQGKAGATRKPVKPGEPNPGDRWQAVDQKDEQLLDGRTATQTVTLMDKLAGDGRPFFLAVGFLKPHVPLVAPKKYFDLYKPESIPLPPAVSGKGEDLSDVPKPALRPNFDLFKTRTPPPQQAREAIQAYYACISFMDAQVGRVLDHLDKRGLRDNTIVVFWGDHGWQLGEHGLWSKMALFEESCRVPLIVAVPGRRPGVSPRLVEFVDLYPTVADLCGLQKPQGLEGASLVPLLDRPDRPWKKAAFTQVRSGGGVGRAVRTERWRYIEWESAKQAQLYDHENDPHELTNLAGDPKHKETVAELKRVLQEGWQKALPPQVAQAKR